MGKRGFGRLSLRRDISRYAFFLEGICPDTTMTTNSNKELLRVEGLTVDFDAGKPTAHRALDGVSLSIGVGEVLGLVGESGSGETVLSHAILGLLPSCGRVRSGRNASASEIHQVHIDRSRNINFVPIEEIPCHL